MPALRATKIQDKKSPPQNAFQAITPYSWIMALVSVIFALFHSKRLDILKPFVFLSYPEAAAVPHSSSGLDPYFQLFGKGPLDFCFVLGWIFLLNRISAALVVFSNSIFSFFDISKPMTASHRSRLVTRFSEQLYLALFYGTSWSVGYAIYTHSAFYPITQNAVYMWKDYPQIHIHSLTKAYYLIQASFWIQEIVRLTILTPVQDRRKDHYPMLLHHVITSTLILTSYCFHFTSIGVMVLVTFDISDLLLSVAKLFKYAGPKFQTICDLFFGSFVISWIFTRHVLFFKLMHSLVVELPSENSFVFDAWWRRQIPENTTFSLFAEGNTLLIGNPASEEEMKAWMRPGNYMDTPTWIGFISLFAVLQGLLCFWLFLILKVVARVVSGKGADDNREEDD